MADINRTTTITLPSEISSEIIADVQQESAIMRLARRVELPGRGLTIPVITGDPQAAWVAETAAKPVSNSTLNTKLMQAYKIAVIETVSREFTRDAAALYDELIRRLPAALASVFDSTVIGNTQAPGANFDTFAAATAQSFGTDVYAALVAANTDIANNGGVLNGFALGAQGRGALLAAVDGDRRPLFINNVSEGAIPRVLGAPVYINKALYKAASGSDPAVYGIAGDWTSALYGTVEGVQIRISDQATLTSGQTTINLFQQNMIAVLAEIEVGFRADVDKFNLLTA